jgi:ribosomal protein S18 acetylase RimI-like enzyme
MDIRILRLGDEDLLIEAVELADEGPLSRERAAAHLADEDLISVIATEAGTVAGFAYGYILRRFERTSFFIYSVDVADRFKRRGIGKAMLTALKEHGKNVGYDEMFVFTNAGNQPAMALYSSAGGVRPNPDDVMFDFDCEDCMDP